MSEDTGRLSRRAWLKWAASSATALLISGCQRIPSATPDSAPQETLTPAGDQPEATDSPPPSTTPGPAASETATPTIELSAILPELVEIEAGDFLMGSDSGEENEHPVHLVRIEKDYYLGKYPVTFNEFDRYCEAIQSAKPADEGYGRGLRPVIYIDWNEAVAYCNWLSEQAGLVPCYSGRGKATKCDFSADGFRLPTEAEWEFAARGGLTNADTLYAGSDDPDEVAWYAENSAGQTHPVGQKAPNSLGLYDLSGNVWEWCWDKYLKTYYAESPEIDPTGPERGQENIYLGGWERSRRGGAYNEGASALRVTARSHDGQAYKGFVSGFRLARTITS